MNQSKTTGQFILVLHDITQLRQLNSMRRDFISNLSHELRTPVSVIRANSETLLDGALDNKKDAKVFSKAILHNAERLSSMVTDLIDLSRIDYGDLKFNISSIDLNKFIDSLISSMTSLAKKKNITLSYKPNHKHPIKADSQALERVMNNLVDNAFKYSPNDSVIEITTTENKGFIKGIDLAKIAAKIAAVSFPVLAPALPGLLATLTNAKTAALIDPTTGNSRLQKLTSIIGGAALVASIIGGFILVAIALLKSIDAFLEKCDPNNMNSLLPISKEVQDIADAQLQADNTQNLTTYQGFIIEIEIVPYTPTVDRRRAVGKNQSGIVLIQTELSFTTDEQTLINELKLIIDRDNLKAY